MIQKRDVVFVRLERKVLLSVKHVPLERVAITRLRAARWSCLLAPFPLMDYSILPLPIRRDNPQIRSNCNAILNTIHPLRTPTVDTKSGNSIISTSVFCLFLWKLNSSRGCTSLFGARRIIQKAKLTGQWWWWLCTTFNTFSSGPHTLWTVPKPKYERCQTIYLILANGMWLEV